MNSDVRPLSRLRRFWVRDTGVDEDSACLGQQAFISYRAELPGIAFLVVMGGGLLTAINLATLQLASDWHMLLITVSLDSVLLLLLWHSLCVAPRQAFKKLHRALSDEEVQRLIDKTHEPLKREYLALVSLAVRMEPSVDQADARILRDVLQAIGITLENLPPHVLAGVNADPSHLKGEASQLASEAQIETDPLIAASLLRRAEAVTCRAETMARSAMLIRRNAALRRELAEQIEALQTTLAVLNLGGAHPVHGLATLARGVQRVATQAGSLAAARAELDDALGASGSALASATEAVTPALRVRMAGQ